MHHRQKENRASFRYEVFFGGPDQRACRLRDLLADHIAAVPAGGSIDWVTYYFRDQKLAQDLVKAHRRGVKVTVSIEERPRTVEANAIVVEMLSGPEGLGNGFRTVYLRGPLAPLGGGWKPHLHEKLYCFSHPTPIAFIGSFNPSGNGPQDDPAIIDEIGDQDRGHNVLVELRDSFLVEKLVRHARSIHRLRYPVFHRFSKAANRVVKGDDTEIFFWPRLRPNLALQFLSRLGANARIRIAASHIKGPSVVKGIARLAHGGAEVEILAEPTFRRVPVAVEGLLREAGVGFRRVTHPAGLPMHNKFVLAEKGTARWAIFGSFNWTTRSYWLNYEIGAISTNAEVFGRFAERWEVLASQRN
jgi:phosphatidylserine/phosphatidylglycerophosphate/cardiolipin synthase-like enzyme